MNEKVFCGDQNQARPETILEAFEKARADYFDACHIFNEADQRKRAAFDRVSSLAEKAAQYLQEGTCDPTIPKVPQAMAQTRAY